MLVKETYIDRTTQSGYGDSDWYEVSVAKNLGDLYRAMQREHGRCAGKVYVDDKNGKSKQIGWIFQQRRTYSNFDQSYLSETWVEVAESVTPQPTIVVHAKFD